MSIVAYKNRNTGQVVAYPSANPRLDALYEWERTSATDVSYTIADAHDRAAAERESIEAAAAIRLDGAAGAAARGVAEARAFNVAPEGGVVADPLPTLSTGSAGEEQNLVALLDKGDASRDSATTSFEENKRRADEELLHPPTTGVLTRAKQDHKSGATQIGDNPGLHAGPAAAGNGTGDDIVTGDTGTTGTTGVDGAADGAVARPADSANKPDWVAYAVSRGAEHDAADAKTKQALIDEYGAAAA